MRRSLRRQQKIKNSTLQIKEVLRQLANIYYDDKYEHKKKIVEAQAFVISKPKFQTTI